MFIPPADFGPYIGVNLQFSDIFRYHIYVACLYPYISTYINLYPQDPIKPPWFPNSRLVDTTKAAFADEPHDAEGAQLVVLLKTKVRR